MYSIRFRFLCAAAAVLMAVPACSMPFAAPPSTPTFTAPAPTQTKPPSQTPTPAATATETLTPEPSLSPTTEIPVAEVVTESNCRKGPGGMYDLVLTFKTGD